MAHLEPMSREDHPEYAALLSEMEARSGFLPNIFLTMGRRPELLAAFQAFLQQVFSGSVPRETKSLVALMSSYGAGCRYCQAHQASSLVKQGVDPAKLADAHDFERSERFSPAERAAMRLAFASGQQPNAVTAGHFDELRAHFDDGEVVEIVAVIGAFGFLNRWHETMATELEGPAAEIAGALLGGLAWEPGRHAPS